MDLGGVIAAFLITAIVIGGIKMIYLYGKRRGEKIGEQRAIEKIYHARGTNGNGKHKV